MRKFIAFGIAAAFVSGGIAIAAQQGAAAKKLLVKSPPSGNKKIVYLSKNATSTINGDPTLNGATFITTWFLSAFFLLAVAPLALAQGRRIVGWSAVAIAVETLVGTAASPNNLGQLSSMFTLIWVVGVCIALLRREPRRAAVPAVA